MATEKCINNDAMTWRRFPHHCSLQWRHNERHVVSNHQRLHCLLNCWFWRRSKKTSKLCVIGFCAGNSPVIGEFPAQKTSNAENVFIWWRRHDIMTSVRRRFDASLAISLNKQTLEKTGGSPVIWNAVTLIWCGCNECLPLKMIWINYNQDKSSTYLAKSLPRSYQTTVVIISFQFVWRS